MGVSQDYTLAYIDILKSVERTARGGSKAESRPPLPRLGGTPGIGRGGGPRSRGELKLPLVLLLAGDGSWESPYVLDPNDTLLRAISSIRGLTHFVDSEWIDFVAEFNARARSITAGAQVQTLGPLLALLTAVADETDLLGGLHVQLLRFWPTSKSSDRGGRYARRATARKARTSKGEAGGKKLQSPLLSSMNAPGSERKAGDSRSTMSRLDDAVLSGAPNRLDEEAGGNQSDSSGSTSSGSSSSSGSFMSLTKPATDAVVQDAPDVVADDVDPDEPEMLHGFHRGSVTSAESGAYDEGEDEGEGEGEGEEEGEEDEDEEADGEGGGGGGDDDVPFSLTYAAAPNFGLPPGATSGRVSGGTWWRSWALVVDDTAPLDGAKLGVLITLRNQGSFSPPGTRSKPLPQTPKSVGGRAGKVDFLDAFPVRSDGPLKGASPGTPHHTGAGAASPALFSLGTPHESFQFVLGEDGVTAVGSGGGRSVVSRSGDRGSALRATGFNLDDDFDLKVGVEGGGGGGESLRRQLTGPAPSPLWPSSSRGGAAGFTDGGAAPTPMGGRRTLEFGAAVPAAPTETAVELSGPLVVRSPTYVETSASLLLSSLRANRAGSGCCRRSCACCRSSHSSHPQPLPSILRVLLGGWDWLTRGVLDVGGSDDADGRILLQGLPHPGPALPLPLELAPANSLYATPFFSRNPFDEADRGSIHHRSARGAHIRKPDAFALSLESDFMRRVLTADKHVQRSKGSQRKAGGRNDDTRGGSSFREPSSFSSLQGKDARYNAGRRDRFGSGASGSDSSSDDARPVEGRGIGSRASSEGVGAPKQGGVAESQLNAKLPSWFKRGLAWQGLVPAPSSSAWRGGFSLSLLLRALSSGQVTTFFTRLAFVLTRCFRRTQAPLPRSRKWLVSAAAVLQLGANLGEITVALLLVSELLCVESSTRQVDSINGGGPTLSATATGTCNYVPVSLLVFLPPLSILVPPILGLAAVVLQSSRALRLYAAWNVASLLTPLLGLGLIVAYRTVLARSLFALPLLLLVLKLTSAQCVPLQLVEMESARPVRGWRGLFEVRSGPSERIRQGNEKP